MALFNVYRIETWPHKYDFQNYNLVIYCQVGGFDKLKINYRVQTFYLCRTGNYQSVGFMIVQITINSYSTKFAADDVLIFKEISLGISDDSHGKSSLILSKIKNSKYK